MENYCFFGCDDGTGQPTLAPFPPLVGGSLSRKQILQILAPPIAFHRCLVTVAGSVDAALMLSQAIYWTPRTKDPDGWFYKSQKEWEEETGLSRSEQEIARKQLKSTGFWQEKLKGIPATLYFCVDCEILQTRLLNYNIQVCIKPQTRLQNPATITSSESTSETTHKSAASPRHIELINQAIKESERTGEPADDILKRLRA